MLAINAEVWLTLNQWAVKRRDTCYSTAPPSNATLAESQYDLAEGSQLHVHGVATGQRVAQIKAIRGW